LKPAKLESFGTIFPTSSSKGWEEVDKRKEETNAPLDVLYFLDGSVMFVLNIGYNS